MTNPSNLVITGIDGYFTLIFLQKSGYIERLDFSSLSFIFSIIFVPTIYYIHFDSFFNNPCSVKTVTKVFDFADICHTRLISVHF